MKNKKSSIFCFRKNTDFDVVLYLYITDREMSGKVLEVSPSLRCAHTSHLGTWALNRATGIFMIFQMAILNVSAAEQIEYNERTNDWQMDVRPSVIVSRMGRPVPYQILIEGIRQPVATHIRHPSSPIVSYVWHSSSYVPRPSISTNGNDMPTLNTQQAACDSGDRLREMPSS